MHGRAVVPHQQIALLPLVRPDEAWLCDVRAQCAEKLITGLCVQADDAPGEQGRDKQRFATRLRVRANDRVINRFGGIELLTNMLVDCTHSLQALFHRVVQSIVGRVTTTPLGRAAALRNFNGI